MLSGWITNTYEEIPCLPMNHKEILFAKHMDLVKSLMPDVEERLDAIEDIYDLCLGLEDEDEDGHGEWHIYEIEKDGFDDDFLNALYSNGWIRVGVWSGDMHFEGSRDTLTSRHDYLEEYADKHGYKPVFYNRKVK